MGQNQVFWLVPWAALVSNIFLGQGPWTPWQMFAWGTMGMSAGLLRQFAGMGNLWVLNTFRFYLGFYIWLDDESMDCFQQYAKLHVGIPCGHLCVQFLS